WARFRTTTASHTAGKFVAEFADVVVLGSGHAEIKRAVYGNPPFDFDEILEHFGAVDNKVAHQGEFRHWLKLDRGDTVMDFCDFIDQSGTGLPDVSVHIHGAGAADFFKAGGFPGYGFN